MTFMCNLRKPPPAAVFHQTVQVTRGDIHRVRQAFRMVHQHTHRITTDFVPNRGQLAFAYRDIPATFARVTNRDFRSQRG